MRQALASPTEEDNDKKDDRGRGVGPAGGTVAHATPRKLGKMVSSSVVTETNTMAPPLLSSDVRAVLQIAEEVDGTQQTPLTRKTPKAVAWVSENEENKHDCGAMGEPAVETLAPAILPTQPEEDLATAVVTESATVAPPIASFDAQAVLRIVEQVNNEMS